MSGSDVQDELRPSYRTLGDPTKLLGLSIAHWLLVVAAGGLAYGWLQVSPLGFRLSVSVAAVTLGPLIGFYLLFGSEGMPVGRVARGVFSWRFRASHLIATTAETRPRRGALVLRERPVYADQSAEVVPWADEIEEARS